MTNETTLAEQDSEEYTPATLELTLAVRVKVPPGVSAREYIQNLYLSIPVELIEIKSLGTSLGTADKTVEGYVTSFATSYAGLEEY